VALAASWRGAGIAASNRGANHQHGIISAAAAEKTSAT